MTSIRPERPGDAAAIGPLITEAFLTAAHRDGTEAAIVDRLRADGALLVSLVATDGAALVGHVAASPATVGGRPAGPASARSPCRSGAFQTPGGRCVPPSMVIPTSAAFGEECRIATGRR